MPVSDGSQRRPEKPFLLTGHAPVYEQPCARVHLFVDVQFDVHGVIESLVLGIYVWYSISIIFENGSMVYIVCISREVPLKISIECHWSYGTIGFDSGLVP